MAIYSLGINTTVATIAAACADIRASAANAPRLMELGITLGAATASVYALGRPAAVGTQTAPVLLQAENPNDPAAQTGTAVAWSVAPTVPAQFFRRQALPATVGAGIIWTFPRGLIIPAGGSLVLWNITANSASANVYFVADE
jgi:hypothetical protein